MITPKRKRSTGCSYSFDFFDFQEENGIINMIGMFPAGLDNPDNVPPEIMETFWIKKAQQTA